MGIFHSSFKPNIEGLLRQKRYNEIRRLASSDVKVLDTIMNVLRDGDASEQEIAAEALGCIGSKEAVPSLIKALDNRDPGVCLSAVNALAKIGDQEAVKPLIKLIGYGKLGTYFVPEALVKIGTTAVEPLIEALENGPGIVCWRVAWALAEIGDTRAVGPLIKLLEELRSSESSRLHDFRTEEILGLYEALGKLGDERATQYLLRVLKEGYRDGRYWAAKALGEIGDTRALPELERVAKEFRMNLRSPTVG